jgi:membrane-bound ClpP family serine protease
MFGFDQLFLWSLLLLLLGLACLVLEMFVPSGGMLGVLSTLSILSALVLAFMSGPMYGSAMTIAVTILVPVILAVAVKYWPHTPLGKLIMLTPPESVEEVLPSTEAYRTRNLMIGKKGVAKSPMLPSGVVLIEGRTYDAISSGMPIEANQPICVVGVDTQRLVVRAEKLPFDSQPTPQPTANNSPLSQTMEDPFA